MQCRKRWIDQLVQYSLFNYHKCCFYLHSVGLNSSELELDDIEGKNFIKGYKHNAEDLYLGYECVRANTSRDFRYLYEIYKYPELKVYADALLYKDIVQVNGDGVLDLGKYPTHLGYICLGYDRYEVKKFSVLSQKILLYLAEKLNLYGNLFEGSLFITDSRDKSLDDKFIMQYLSGRVNPVNENSKKLLDYLDKKGNRKELKTIVSNMIKEGKQSPYEIWVGEDLKFGYSHSGEFKYLPDDISERNIFKDFDGNFLRSIHQSSYSQEFINRVKQFYKATDFFTGMPIPALANKGFNGEFIAREDIKRYGLSIKGAGIDGYYPLISVGGL